MKRVRTAFVALLGLAALTAGTIVVAPPAGAAKKPTTITVLVTNDDGVSAPGIDALVQALRTSKNTKVVVVAPATNQTSTGGATTPGTLPTAPATTASGYAATAVQGYPGRHRHRRPRSARREAERGDVGHQRRPELTGRSLRSRAPSAPPRWRPGAGSPPSPSASRPAARRNTTPPGSSRSRGWRSTVPRWRRSRRPRPPRSRATTCRTAPSGKSRGVLKVATAVSLTRDRRRPSTARPPARSRPPTSRRSTRATPASRTVPVG